MRVCVVGTGYVGLVAGACLAGTGNTVICADIDEAKIQGLKEGVIPIYEPGLGDIVRRNARAERLTFTTDVAAAIREAEVVFIAVGTPPGEDGSADLKHVLTVARNIGENLNDYKVVVVKSTVPVGTCEKVRAAVKEVTDKEFDVVSNPEFLKEGAAVNDFLHPDRVVVGVDSDRAFEYMEELYTPFMRRSNRLIRMDIKSSEMTKYASNAMLATKISFINEVARLCEEVGADIELVRTGMAADQRIGPHFIYAGIGYGGSCFPKDIKALVGTGKEYGLAMRVLEAVEEVNAGQKRRAYERLVEHFGSLEGRKVGVWGLAFKPRTDDMREAPAEVLIRALVEAGAKVVAHDPEALETAQEAMADLDNVEFTTQAYKCAESADALVVCTEWNEYRTPDFLRLAELMAHKVIVDGRNVYRPARLKRLGFSYYSIGRPVIA